MQTLIYKYLGVLAHFSFNTLQRISSCFENSPTTWLKLTGMQTVHFFEKHKNFCDEIPSTIAYKLKKLSDAIKLIFDVTASDLTDRPSMYHDKYLQ